MSLHQGLISKSSLHGIREPRRQHDRNYTGRHVAKGIEDKDRGYAEHFRLMLKIGSGRIDQNHTDQDQDNAGYDQSYLSQRAAPV